MYTGNLKKMVVRQDDPVRYELHIGDQQVNVNALIGSSVSFTFNGRINCLDCGNTTPKSYANGFCYSCMIKSPMNSECIIRPELCKAHLHEGRDPEWEKNNHLQPHVAYLAVASGLKVGVTRASQIPTRWIDQGAWRAIRLSEAPNRFIAGCIETALKNYISDKTHWQRMLLNIKAGAIDLKRKKEELNNLLPEELQKYFSHNNEIMEFQYPVQKYPLKVQSTGFDKAPQIKGTLSGIRGQYLIFSDGRVLNIRKHNGYHIHLENQG